MCRTQRLIRKAIVERIEGRPNTNTTAATANNNNNNNNSYSPSTSAASLLSRRRSSRRLLTSNPWNHSFFGTLAHAADEVALLEDELHRHHVRSRSMFNLERAQSGSSAEEEEDQDVYDGVAVPAEEEKEEVDEEVQEVHEELPSAASSAGPPRPAPLTINTNTNPYSHASNNTYAGMNNNPHNVQAGSPPVLTNNGYPSALSPSDANRNYYQQQHQSYSSPNAYNNYYNATSPTSYYHPHHTPHMQPHSSMHLQQAPLPSHTAYYNTSADYYASPPPPPTHPQSSHADHRQLQPPQYRY